MRKPRLWKKNGLWHAGEVQQVAADLCIRTVYATGTTQLEAFLCLLAIVVGSSEVAIA